MQDNLGLVGYVLRWYPLAQLSGLSVEDLFQEGCLGLMHAAEKYNPARGALSTYALHWIRQAVLRAIEAKSRLVYVPYWRQYGRNKDELHKKFPATWVPRSLDKPLMNSQVHEPSTMSDGPRTLADTLESHDPSPEEIAEQNEKGKLVDRLMTEAKLTERERYVVRRRYSGGTLKGIGAELGVSRERIRQIENIAMRKLRKAAQSAGFV